MIAAIAAECAGELGDYWAMHDWLFQNQRAWKFKPTAEQLITNAAIQLGFDQQAFTECLSSRRYEEEVKADDQEALRAGALGTPTFMINGRLFRGFMPYQRFRSVVEAVMAEDGGQ